MPHFAISCIDIDDGGALRARTYEAHLAHVHAAGDKVIFAGPYIDGEGRSIGSLLVVNVDSAEDAQAFVDGDPYVKAGVFQSVEIRAWRLVISNI